MIKKQIERLKDRINIQKNKVIERRTKHAKRDFLNSIYGDYRQSEMTIVTLTISKLRQLWVSCGKEAVWDILSDGETREPNHQNRE